MKKTTKDSKYKSVVNKAKKIALILESSNSPEDEVHDAVVDLVSIIEYVIKKKLFNKNKILIYELNSIEANDIKHILKGTIKGRNTVGAFEAFNRYKLFYPKSKLIKQTEGVEVLIRNRNELMHGISTKDIPKKEDLVAILGVVFTALILDSESVLGTLPVTKISKEKTFTEKDRQKVYEDILLSKINNYKNTAQETGLSELSFSPNTFNVQPETSTPLSTNQLYLDLADFNKETCPRCKRRAMSRTGGVFHFSFSVRTGVSDLYICSKCNLELTPTEYEMVKKLQKEGKIRNWSLI